MPKKKQHFITREGLAKLKHELEYLKTIKAAEIAARLKEALSYGDLKENAEYQSAREEELLNDARIREIEDELMHAEVVDESTKRKDIVELGSKVQLKNHTEDEILDVEFVGSTEVNPAEHRFSNESPLGDAVLGKKAGETVVYQSPKGEMKIEILKIS